jgi:hypothetical protein
MCVFTPWPVHQIHFPLSLAASFVFMSQDGRVLKNPFLKKKKKKRLSRKSQEHLFPPHSGSIEACN